MSKRYQTKLTKAEYCKNYRKMQKMDRVSAEHTKELSKIRSRNYRKNRKIKMAKDLLADINNSLTENSSKSSHSFCKTTNLTETNVENLEYEAHSSKRKRSTKHLSPRRKSKRAHKTKCEKKAVIQRALCLMERCTDDCQIFADFIASRLRKLNEAKREELQRSIQLQILQAEAEESIAVGNHKENQTSSAPVCYNFSDVSHN